MESDNPQPLPPVVEQGQVQPPPVADGGQVVTGQTYDENVPVDYFGFSATEQFYLPDGKQYIEFQVMNEGKKAEFQRLTSRDFVLQRQTGDARIKVDPASERHQLIKQSVTGWNMYRGGQPYRFSKQALNDFLTLTNPKIVEDLEEAIRKANPWMIADMSVEEIDREIENLQEMRKLAAEREAGEASSGSK